jgi:dimethylargininase
MFSRAFLRAPGLNVHEGLTTADLGAPDFALMQRQHAGYRQALESSGVVTTLLDADLRYPDGCFIEDTAVVAGGLAVITRPGAPSRRGEVDAIAEIMACRAELARIEEPGTVDGGDVLVIGDVVLVGLSSRTNATGIEQLAALLVPRGFRVRAVPVQSALVAHASALSVGLHLKSDVTAVGDRLLVTRAYAGHSELADFSQIVVPDGEEYAANCLDLGNCVLVADGFPRTLELLEREGIEVQALDVSEFRKLDGGLSCLSLRF